MALSLHLSKLCEHLVDECCILRHHIVIQLLKEFIRHEVLNLTILCSLECFLSQLLQVWITHDCVPPLMICLQQSISTLLLLYVYSWFAPDR